MPLQALKKPTGSVNGNLGRSATALGTVALNLLDDIVSFNDLAKDNVLSVQPSGLGSADKELRSVGVGTGIGHGKDTFTSMLQGEVFVFKLGSIDGLATGTVMVSEITALAPGY